MKKFNFQKREELTFLKKMLTKNKNERNIIVLKQARKGRFYSNLADKVFRYTFY